MCIHSAIKIEAQVFLSPLQLRENAASFKEAKRERERENKKFRVEIMKPAFLLHCFLILQNLRYKINMNYIPKIKLIRLLACPTLAQMLINHNPS
jgi:hypothetical protein